MRTTNCQKAKKKEKNISDIFSFLILSFNVSIVMNRLDKERKPIETLKDNIKK